MEDDDIYPEDSASQINEPINERIENRTPYTQESEGQIASRVRDNVREYLDIGEKIKKINVALRELRKKKNTLENALITDMQRLEVENLALNNKGTLIAKHTYKKVPLTKTSIMSLLSKNFEDQELVGQIMTILYEKRDKFESVELTHRIKKQ
jgi:hypothetical protein